MSTKGPTEGRCNARTRDGGFCATEPVAGSTRCRMHGGTSTGEHRVTHGLASTRLRARYADEETRQRLDALLADPHLLDARRAAAVSQVALEEMPWQPRREDGVRMAKRLLKLDDQEPTEDQVNAALHELRAVYAERVLSGANAHARTLALAAKQEKVAEILVRGAVPIMRRFAERVSGLVRKYLPPSKQAEFLRDLAKIVEDTQLEIVKFGEEADVASKG